MEGDVDQARRRQFGKQVPLRADPIREQRRPHAPVCDVAHDLDEVRGLAQGPFTARDLHVRVRSITCEDVLDAPMQLVKGVSFTASAFSER